LFVVGGGVVAALLLIRWAVLTPVREQAGGQVRATTSASDPERESFAVWMMEEGALDDPRETHERWSRLIEEAMLAAAQGPVDAAGFVERLVRVLDELRPADRLAVTANFFESGLDADLGLPFVVGADRRLVSWPTLRVALYEHMCRRDVEAARLLASSWVVEPAATSTAELALALRELSAGQEAHAWSPEVRAAATHLLRAPDRGEAANSGWAESLDLIPAGRAIEFLPELCGLAGRDRPRDVQQAAQAALESFMHTTPARVLETLNASPALLGDSSGQRAAVFARADVRVPEQRLALEAYFLRADVLAGERAQFVAQFPRLGPPGLPRLFTAIETQSAEDAAAQIEATRTQLDAWLADPVFAAWHDGLTVVRSRLN
jgi:hypothetical protein